MNFDKEAKIGTSAMKKSGKILIEYFEQEKELIKHSKGEGDFATEADFAAEKLIVNMISRHFPEHDILSEEMGSANKKSDYRWIIDPLDGTHNFSFGIPFWATMLALEYKKEIVFSSIFLPSLGELCTAEKGKGTYLNGKQVQVSKRSQNENLILSFSGLRSYNKPDIRNIFEKTAKAFHKEMRVMGSIAVSGVFVASGRMDGIIATFNVPWDMAPSYLIIKEAGGLVTDIKDKPWTIDSGSFIATNPQIHDKVIKILK